MSAELDRIEAAAVLLRADPLEALQLVADAVAMHPNEQVRLVGDWLRAGGSAALLAYISGQDGRRGHSVVLEAQHAARNAALREAAKQWRDLAPKKVTKLLASEFARYFSDCWPRDRERVENPFPADSQNGLFWIALRAVPQAIGEAQCARILAG